MPLEKGKENLGRVNRTPCLLAGSSRDSMRIGSFSERMVESGLAAGEETKGLRARIAGMASVMRAVRLAVGGGVEELRYYVLSRDDAAEFQTRRRAAADCGMGGLGWIDTCRCSGRRRQGAQDRRGGVCLRWRSRGRTSEVKSTVGRERKVLIVVVV